MTALIVSALVAIACANAFVWWMWGRIKKAEIDNLWGHLSRVQDERDEAMHGRIAAQRDARLLREGNQSLRDRNEMLLHLVGGER